MSESHEYEHITIEVDADLLERVAPIFASHGLTPERVVEHFLTWVTKYPEEAMPYLLDLKGKYGPMND